MLHKLFKVFRRGLAAQQSHPPAVEPPATGPAVPQGPGDDLRRVALRAAVEESARWIAEEVLPYLF
ncbi:hypothetical protein [Streptomyces anulatus]|uniref:hypothetical protein n=1 Tax=Streptomyces anulatus TaxID=1892 RepID=UPI00369C300C